MNITKATNQYISERPSIKDCIKKGLVNYSALSRQVSKETGIKNFEAIVIACRRYAYSMKKEQASENQIKSILKASKISVKNKRLAAVIERGAYIHSISELEKEVKKSKETLHIIEGENATTLITSEDFVDLIKKQFKNEIIKINMNLCEIGVKSPREIENVPGVVAYLYSLFGERGINVVESMSCWTDTLFLIRENDIQVAISVLKF